MAVHPPVCTCAAVHPAPPTAPAHLRGCAPCPPNRASSPARLCTLLAARLTARLMAILAARPAAHRHTVPSPPPPPPPPPASALRVSCVKLRRMDGALFRLRSTCVPPGAALKLSELASEEPSQKLAPPPAGTFQAAARRAHACVHVCVSIYECVHACCGLSGTSEVCLPSLYLCVSCLADKAMCAHTHPSKSGESCVAGSMCTCMCAGVVAVHGCQIGLLCPAFQQYTCEQRD